MPNSNDHLKLWMWIGRCDVTLSYTRTENRSIMYREWIANIQQWT